MGWYGHLFQKSRELFHRGFKEMAKRQMKTIEHDGLYFVFFTIMSNLSYMSLHKVFRDKQRF